MHSVAVSQNGVALGTVQFRGIVITPAAASESRLFRCSPKACVPKGIVRKIADRLTFGITAGHEDDYEWHT